MQRGMPAHRVTLSSVVRIVFAAVVVAAGCSGGEAKPEPRVTAVPPCPAGPTVDAAVTAAATAPPPAPCPSAAPIDHLTLAPADFTDLPGWADDKHAEAIPAFVKSCDKLAAIPDGSPVGVDSRSGLARQWRAACKAAASVPVGDDARARAFFEREFRAYTATGDAGADGKFTGYYVQALRGSRTRHDSYVHPIYRRPADLVSVDLELYLSDARGRHVWGKLDSATGSILPYPTRKEIRQGLFAGKGLEIFWVDDPVDALFTHVEGSGKITLDDGTVAWIEFEGKNGRKYRGVGGVLRGLGEPPGTGTMQGIRAWFAAHPGRFDEIADQDEAFIFFKESAQPGAIGSQMTVLTSRRSLAVDRAFVAFSTPIWVDTRAPVIGATGEHPWRHLLIAQDTGGGIKGAVRGDVYWGDDADAGDIAGRMGGPGRWWLLLPRAVDVR